MKLHPLRTITVSLAGIVVFAAAGCSNGTAGDSGTDAATEQVSSAQPGKDDVVLRYHVEGMHCGGCAASIASTVGEIEGVTSCDASFDDSAAVVHVSGPGVSEQVMEAIRELGYTVEPAADEPS